MFEIDQISQCVAVDTDYTLHKIEEELESRGFTLGYYVPPKNEIRLDEALSQRLKNLYGTFYGELSDLCIDLQLHTPKKNLGTFLAPRQAAGPDWKNFILGSEQALGLIYRATLKIFPQTQKSLILAVGLAHDIASHQLEQEMIRQELSPLLFGRFALPKLPKGLRVGNSSMILLTVWSGSKAWVDACKRELEERLEERYSYKWIEGEVLMKNAQKILHEKYPLTPWGGIPTFRKEEGKAGLEREILKALI